jgi:hypothetical protein
MKPLQRGHCIRSVLQSRTLDSWWKNGSNGSNESDHTVESIVFAESRPVVGEAMLKWSHNSTLYCTLSHFPTPICLGHLRCRPLYALRGSVNHTYWAFSTVYAHSHKPLQRGLRTIRVYTNTVSGIDLVSIHICGNHSRTIRLLRVMITTRLFFNTV